MEPREAVCWEHCFPTPHIPSTWTEPTQRKKSELAPFFFFYTRPSLGSAGSSQPGPDLPGWAGESAQRKCPNPRPFPGTECGFCPRLPHSVLAVCVEPEVRREATYQANSGSPPIGHLSKVTPLASEETVVDLSTLHAATASRAPPPFPMRAGGFAGRGHVRERVLQRPGVQVAGRELG